MKTPRCVGKRFADSMQCLGGFVLVHESGGVDYEHLVRPVAVCRLQQRLRLVEVVVKHVDVAATACCVGSGKQGNQMA